MTRKPINQFKGWAGFLSNFYPVTLIIDGIIYPSAEHAYQAMKAGNAETRQWVADARTAAIAKRRGRSITFHPEWDKLKVDVMRTILYLKFNPEGTEEQRRLANLLAATRDAQLIEGNDWGDTFWGMVEGKGKNMLGKLLMEVREANRKTRRRIVRSGE